MRKTGPTNQNLRLLISELRKESSTRQSKLWKRIADDLEMPTRRRRIVNISKINRYAKDNEIVIVPGKVLGSGMLGRSVTVAAFSFSETAKNEIEKAKGKCLTISELLKQNPKGKDVRVLG